jgi:hypothetical protein
MCSTNRATSRQSTHSASRRAGREGTAQHLDPNQASALAAAKARGVQLGNAEQAKENEREADRYAKTLLPILIELRHLPVEKIADELGKVGLTKRKVATPRGGRRHGMTVARLLDRLHLR